MIGLVQNFVLMRAFGPHQHKILNPLYDLTTLEVNQGSAP